VSALAVTGAQRLDGDGATSAVGLRSVDGVITEVGPHVQAEPGDEVLDGTDRVLTPGFVNGHTHAAMTLFRGYGGDLPLMEWLEQKIWPVEAHLEDDDVYWGTRLACCEMIRTGTVTFWDMYWRPRAVARAVEDAGLRATVGLPLIDGLDPARSNALRVDAIRSLEELADCSPRITPSFAPHGTYTVSEESLTWVADEATARRLPVHLHFLELQNEVTGIHERTGERPAAYLERIGLLGPLTVLAHGGWLEDDDLDLVAAGGSTVVTNPASNMKLAVGRTFPFAAARRRGIPVGLGTDGASSNNGLDLLQDAKLLSILQKFVHDDPTALPASDAWAVLTGRLAPLLGGSALEPGSPADFLLLRADAPELGPGHLLANLVFAASGTVVDTTVVAGRVLMRGGQIDDQGEVRARARERADRLGLLGS
jgi:5-methylthioadenosine/S-adenosylhomocysteine deaminase